MGTDDPEIPSGVSRTGCSLPQTGTPHIPAEWLPVFFCQTITGFTHNSSGNRSGYCLVFIPASPQTCCHPDKTEVPAYFRYTWKTGLHVILPETVPDTV